MIGASVRNEHNVYEFIQDVSSRVHIARGILETARLLERGKAKLVVLASDVRPASRLKIIRHLCAQKNIETLVVSSRNRLGHCAGLEVPASCVALPISMD
jgi:large subunit ribosomal protein L7Ae